MNEVIVNSDILENYIREMYHEYKITSSTCKRITDPEKLHEELDRDYNLVVVDYDLNNKWDILNNLPHKEKCEFLLNASCFPHCPQRVKGYEMIGMHHIRYNQYLHGNSSLYHSR